MRRQGERDGWLTRIHSTKTALDRWLTSRSMANVDKRNGRLQIVREEYGD